MALTDNLEAYWKLEEASGTRVDETANSNDLTDVNTVTQVTGKIDNAADFTAANTEYLEITDASQTGLDFSSTWSVSAWVNRDATNDTMTVLSKDGVGVNANRSWGVWIDASGKITALASDGSANFDFYDTTETLGSGAWEHVVVTCDTGNASASTFEFYLDGTSLGNGNATLSDNISTIGNGAAPVRIGARPDGAVLSDGSQDETGAWSRVLTSAEVTELYNSGSGLAYPFTAAATFIPKVMMY